MIALSEVDPNDDSIWRWLLQHYRFDPDRCERRSVVVTAYDTAAEFEAALAAYDHRLTAEIEAGTRDGREHLSGVTWNPGYHAEQARGRLARDAVRHGVDPRSVLNEGGLAWNVAAFGWDDDGRPWSIGGGEPPAPPGA